MSRKESVVDRTDLSGVYFRNFIGTSHVVANVVEVAVAIAVTTADDDVVVVVGAVTAVRMLVVSLFSSSWHRGGFRVTAVFSNDWLGAFIRLCVCVFVEITQIGSGKMREDKEEKKKEEKQG